MFEQLSPLKDTIDTLQAADEILFQHIREILEWKDAWDSEWESSIEFIKSETLGTTGEVLQNLHKILEDSFQNWKTTLFAEFANRANGAEREIPVADHHFLQELATRILSLENRPTPSDLSPRLTNMENIFKNFETAMAMTFGENFSLWRNSCSLVAEWEKFPFRTSFAIIVTMDVLRKNFAKLLEPYAAQLCDHVLRRVEQGRKGRQDGPPSQHDNFMGISNSEEIIKANMAEWTKRLEVLEHGFYEWQRRGGSPTLPTPPCVECKKFEQAIDSFGKQLATANKVINDQSTAIQTLQRSLRLTQEQVAKQTVVTNHLTRMMKNLDPPLRGTCCRHGGGRQQV